MKCSLALANPLISSAEIKARLTCCLWSAKGRLAAVVAPKLRPGLAVHLSQVCQRGLGSGLGLDRCHKKGYWRHFSRVAPKPKNPSAAASWVGKLTDAEECVLEGGWPEREDGAAAAPKLNAHQQYAHSLMHKYSTLECALSV